jgi:hypothetical protein
VARLADGRRWAQIVSPVGEWIQARGAERAAIDNGSIQTVRV